MRDLLLAAVIFGSIPFIFYRPHIGVLVWAWLTFMTPFNYAWSFAVGFRWAYLIAAVTVVAWLISREPKRINLSPPSLLLIAFWAFTGLTTVFAMFPDQAQPKWIEFTKVVAIDLVVTVALFADRRRLNALIWVIVASIGFFGVKGGISTILSGGTIHIGAVDGSYFSQNNELAAALVMLVPLLRYLQTMSTEKIVRWGLIVAIALCMIAVLGTQSRGGFVGLVVLAVLLFVRSQRKFATILAVTALFAGGITFMPESWVARMQTISNEKVDTSVQQRFVAWQYGFGLAEDKPLVGGGFEAFRANKDPNSPVGYRTAHSIYFETLGEHGFIGFALYFGVIGATLLLGASIIRRARKTSELAWAGELMRMVQASILVFLVVGIFAAMTYFELVVYLIAITVAVDQVVRAYSRTHDAPARAGELQQHAHHLPARTGTIAR